MSILLALSTAFLASGDVNVELKKSGLILSCSFFPDAVIRYDEIEELEFYENMEPGVRVGGIASPTVSGGWFKNKTLGTYRRYMHAECDECIVIRSEDGIVALNGEDRAETLRLYKYLSRKMDEVAEEEDEGTGD